MKINGVNYAPLRGKVTRACKSKDPQKILAVTKEVVAFFDKNGWPDNWASWCRDLGDGLSTFGGHDHIRAQIADLFHNNR